MNSSTVQENVSIQKDLNTVIISFNSNTINMSHTDTIEQIINGSKVGDNYSVDKIIIDMSNIQYLDSSGMSFLVRNHIDTNRKRKTLLLKNINQGIYQVFKDNRLDKDFNFI